MKEAFIMHTDLIARELTTMYNDHAMNVHAVVRAHHREQDLLRRDLRARVSTLRAQVV